MKTLHGVTVLFAIWWAVYVPVAILSSPAAGLLFSIPVLLILMAVWYSPVRPVHYHRHLHHHGTHRAIHGRQGI